jgi:mannosyltransferase
VHAWLERRPHAALALIALLALALRLILLGAESFWFDEIWAVKQARLPTLGVLADLRDDDVHPPLWPLLLHGWITLFGEAEWVVRLPSALAGTAAVVLIGRFVTRLGGAAWGLTTAALIAVSSYAIDFSQEARVYSLLLALSAASLEALWRFAEAPTSWRRGALWAVLAALMLYAHVFGAFVALAEGLYALIWVPALRGRIVVAGGLALALYAPWVPTQLVQISRVQQDFWIEPMHLSDPLFWMWHWSGYSFVLAAVLAVLAAYGVWAAPPAARRLFGLMAACILGVPALLSVIGQPMFQAKYAITFLIPVFSLVARGLLALPWPRAAVATLVAVLLTVVVLGTYRHTSKEQYRELAALADADTEATLVTEPDMAPYVRFYTRARVATAIPEPLPPRVRLLLAHPIRESALERALGGRCGHTDHTDLVGARTVVFDCTRRLSSERQP